MSILILWHLGLSMPKDSKTKILEDDYIRCCNYIMILGLFAGDALILGLILILHFFQRELLSMFVYKYGCGKCGGFVHFSKHNIKLSRCGFGEAKHLQCFLEVC